MKLKNKYLLKEFQELKKVMKEDYTKNIAIAQKNVFAIMNSNGGEE